MKIREARDEARNVASGGLYFHRHRDRVAVVLDAENYWQLAERRGIHRFPELAFAAGAVAERNIGDFVAMERHVFELAVVRSAICRRYFRGLWTLGKVPS